MPESLRNERVKSDTDVAGRTWSPLMFALDRLFPKRGKAPYSTAERLVTLVIIRAMSFDEQAGAFDSFVSYPTIARWSGVSVARSSGPCRST